MTAKMRTKKREALVKSLGLGASVVAACTAVGIGTTTFYRWCQEDESFELRVMEARMGLIEEVMGELRLQAMGRYVDEVKVVETARGPRVEKRHRWVNGKTSACMALIRMVEKDGKVLAALFGTTEDREGTENRDYDYEHDCEYEGGEGTTKGTEKREPQMDTDGHRFEQEDREDRGDGTTKGTKGTKIGEMDAARVSRFEGDLGDAGIAVRDDCGHHLGGEGEELTTEGAEKYGAEAGSLKAVLHTPEVARVSRFEAKGARKARKGKRKMAKASRRKNRR